MSGGEARRGCCCAVRELSDSDCWLVWAGKRERESMDMTIGGADPLSLTELVEDEEGVTPAFKDW